MRAAERELVGRRRLRHSTSAILPVSPNNRVSSPGPTGAKYICIHVYAVDRPAAKFPTVVFSEQVYSDAVVWRKRMYRYVR